MKDEKSELLRQAYLDEQLSVEETINFEGKLSKQEKIEIEHDKSFESALNTHLSKTTKCPEKLWQDVKKNLTHSSGLPGSETSTFNYYWAFAIAASIIFVCVVAILLFQGLSSRASQNAITVTFSDDLQVFSQHADIPANFQKIRSSLTANDFHINLELPSQFEYHDIRLLGVRYIMLDDEPVAQIYLSCCQKPVAAFLSAKDFGNLENRLLIEERRNPVHSIAREIDNYRLLVIGPHPVTGILDIFS